MKKALQLLVWLLVGGLSLATAPKATATHILGGDLTYIYLANNVYRVNFRFYRDCSGDAVPSSFTLNYRNSASCSSPSSAITLNKQGSTLIGAPYCPNSPSNNCSNSNPLPNYDITTYIADITLAPGVWSMYVYTNGRSRPNIANLLNVDNPTTFNCNGSDNEMFIEATLDNTGGLINNSPRFDPQDFVVQYVGVGQPSTITYSALENDGDSLVYELVAPYDRCGVPITYTPYMGATTAPAGPGGCTPTLPAPVATYSPTLPLPVAFDLVGTCPNLTAVRSFYFNAAARTITFTPSRYLPNTASNCGYNKYQVVMKITEYRRVNGVRRIMGSVRREGVVVVLDGNNRTPSSPVVANNTVNSGVVSVNRPDSLEVRVYAGSYARVSLDFRDPDPTDLLTVTYPTDINTNPAYLDNGAIGSFSLAGNGTANPVGTFIIQPNLSAVGRVVRINLRAEDGACPVKGVQNRVLVIRVLGGSRARIAAVKDGQPVAAPFLSCSGSASLTLNGSVLRPNVVTLPPATAEVPQQYSYQWTAVGNGLPAVTNTPSIVVNPTMTTTYKLTVTGARGFSPLVVDEATVLVRVAPPGVNSFVTTDSISSRPMQAGQAAGPPLPPATFHFRNTSRLLTASADFRLDSIHWTYQRVKDGKGQAVTEAPVLFARQASLADDVSLVLKQPGQYRITVQSAVTLITAPGDPTSQCPVTDVAHLINVADLETTNVITPNGDGKNETFTVQIELQGSKLQIFNRWGRKVEEYASYHNEWSAEGQSAGTYFYAFTDTNGNVTRGWVEVIK